MLSPGDAIRLWPSGATVVVERALGIGGQGEVHEVRLPDGGRLALKWYHPSTASQHQRERIERLVSVGAPDDRFLWPIQVATREAEDEQFGYLMELVPPSYSGITAVLTGKVQLTAEALLESAHSVADSLRHLHERGFHYGDISYGNVVVERVTGRVLLLDVDTVRSDHDSEPDDVLGTPGFMAPELMRSEARPSVRTDLYALSVLLFLLFIRAHPLEGRREAAIHSFDANAQRSLYGVSPLFIFDPDDDSNRPVQGLHDAAARHWTIYPTFFKALFLRAFTVGLHDPASRVTESEWCQAIARLKACLIVCPSCGAANYRSDFDVASISVDGQCWSCHAALVPRFFFVFGGLARIELRLGSRLFSPSSPGTTNQDELIGEVTQHPTKPNIVGLTNLSTHEWRVSLHNGTARSVLPGKTVRLQDAVRIIWPTGEGKIVADLASGEHSCHQIGTRIVGKRSHGIMTGSRA